MDSDRIRETARDAAGRIEAGYGRLTDDPDARLDGLGRQAAGTAQAVYGQAKDGLRDVADRAAGYAGDVYDQGRRYVDQGSRELNDKIETNPVMAIILASFLGYLLGIATGMGRRR